MLQEVSIEARPTPLRVGADERFTGRGLTMAFLDSGFYPHPDLQPENRVLVANSSCLANNVRTANSPNEPPDESPHY